MGVREDNYIVIQGWMVNNLGLKGNELLVYSIIYGFSQSGDSQCFMGGISYLTSWTGASKPTIIATLKSLLEKGLITKEEEKKNGVKFCKYSVNLTSGKEFLPWGGKETLPGGGKEILPNNKSSINNDSINNIIGQKRKRFVRPTLDEVREYCIERKNNVDPQKFFDHYEANGWKVGKNSMKDWKAAVRYWERSGYNGKKVGPNGIVLNPDADDDLDGVF